jgi:hypothetical protein
VGIVYLTLPRDGTDFMTLRCEMGIVYPTLPRDGTDVMKQAPPSVSAKLTDQSLRAIAHNISELFMTDFLAWG